MNALAEALKRFDSEPRQVTVMRHDLGPDQCQKVLEVVDALGASSGECDRLVS